MASLESIARQTFANLEDTTHKLITPRALARRRQYRESVSESAAQSSEDEESSMQDASGDEGGPGADSPPESAARQPAKKARPSLPPRRVSGRASAAQSRTEGQASPE